METSHRAVSPVVATLFMIAIVFVVAGSLWAVWSGITQDISEPAPNVAETTGDFQLEATEETGFQDNQIVRITHTAGDEVPVEEIEIIVRASGPDVDDETRLVDLPAEGQNIDQENKEGDELVSTSAGENQFGNDIPEHDQIIIDDDSNTWGAGDEISFRIKTTEADFREDSYPNADELDIIVVHSPSEAILFEDTFRP